MTSKKTNDVHIDALLHQWSSQYKLTDYKSMLIFENIQKEKYEKEELSDEWMNGKFEKILSNFAQKREILYKYRAIFFDNEFDRDVDKNFTVNSFQYYLKL